MRRIHLGLVIALGLSLSACGGTEEIPSSSSDTAVGTTDVEEMVARGSAHMKSASPSDEADTGADSDVQNAVEQDEQKATE